jgi:very-short-patch-repair endonuclease
MKKYINDKELHLGAGVKTFQYARTLRINATEAEVLLWKELRNGNLNNFKFRRQHPLGRFIADFYCHQARLAIEIDGDSHTMSTKKEYDDERSYELSEQNIMVIRFTNSEVLNDLNKTLQIIKNTIIQILLEKSQPKQQFH